MPPCPPHLAHTASRVSSPTCFPSFHLIFLSSDLFAAACLFSCFFPYSGSFSCFPAFHRTSSSAYTPREVRPNLPALLGEGTRNPHNIIPPVRQIQLEQPADLPRRQRFSAQHNGFPMLHVCIQIRIRERIQRERLFYLPKRFPDGQPPICKYHILPLCASAVHQERNSCHNACKNRQQECPLANPHNKAQGQKQRQRRRENASIRKSTQNPRS